MEPAVQIAFFGREAVQIFNRHQRMFIDRVPVVVVADYQRIDGGEFREQANEDEQRAADLRAHVSGTGGPSPARVTGDAAGVAAEQEREARQHARDMAAEDGDLDDCEPTL